MNHFTTIASLTLAATAMNASADVLLLVDLTVANEITISATDGLSAATISGSDTTGVYLQNFYNSFGNVTDTLISGDLTSAENSSDLSPNLFRAGSDAGLNIFSFTDDPSASFTAGTVAFTGSATWSIPMGQYMDMLDGNVIGNLYFPADDSGDISSATLLGTWQVIPAPSTAALFGMGGMLAFRRRRD